MSSIGRIITSAVSIPTELTVAAAAFNIDFSLLKFEAPAVFHGVRDALSIRRRDDAEHGLPHITARRLGALFDANVPKIPNLIEAYGKRVSEICSTLDANIKPRPDAGIFRAQAGLDGTSIWAGATSGNAALAVHLLACLLAKIWKSNEAISLWVELVERRKQEIQSTFTGGNPTELTAAMAAQQIITRDHLAAWDASARSWLHTADSAKRRQQTQLMLIINNLSISVNSNSDPYESVMKAWISALETMERLVQGIPQRVADGGILLAVSSWHLYPNMEVLMEEVKKVDQGDELMRGAVITLSRSTFCSNKEGVFWSLPLSRMRFYHAPEVAERRLASDTSRVTMDELWIVILGAMGGKWADEDRSIEQFCELIKVMEQRVGSKKAGFVWLKPLARAALRCADARDIEKQHAVKLFMLGRRRGHRFLSSYADFLTRQLDRNSLLAMIDDDDDYNNDYENRRPGLGSQNLISILRLIAQGLDYSAEDLIIRYLCRPMSSSHEPVVAFASVLPEPRGSSKRTHDSGVKPALGHTHWVVAGHAWNCSRGWLHCAENLDPRPTLYENIPPMVRREYPGTRTPSPVACSRGTGMAPTHPANESSSLSHTELPDCSLCSLIYTKKDLESTGEVYHFLSPAHHNASIDGYLSLKKPGDTASVMFLPLLETRYAALCIRKGARVRIRSSPGTSQENTSDEVPQLSDPTALELCKILSHQGLNIEKLSSHLSLCNYFDPAARRTVVALEFVTTLYQNMEGATVDLEVLNLALSKTSWAIDLWSKADRPFENDENESSHQQAEPVDITWSDIEIKGEEYLACVFACIALFDSGYYDINPSSLREVFALSSGDSIYVASILLVDPASYARPRSLIKRVFGNLGRSGMSFLISPAEPRLVPHSLESWRLVNHRPFDREFQNSFPGTSLHLSYTDYEMPINLGTHGLRDNQAVLVEAVITLDDKGKRLGDLNIGPLISNPLFKLYEIMHHCIHGDAERRSIPSGSSLSSLRRLVSIDCWDELFEFPDRNALFRATGSWEARLAGLAASLQMKKEVMVLPESPCLTCLAQWLDVNEDLKGECHVIIA